MDKKQKYMGLSDLRHASIDVNKLLKTHGYQNKPLDFDQAYALGVFTLSPFVKELFGLFDCPREVMKVQSVSALCAFHNMATYKEEDSARQIAGICAAVLDYDVGTSANGFVTPQVDVIDNCGMGGDLIRTPNLSTLAALIASAGEVPMLKHGSPGNTDNVGSSDFLQSCGVDLFSERGKVEAAVRDICFSYTDALDERYKRIHTQTHHYAKLAHMNDIIGPMTTPVDPLRIKKKIIGVNHLIPPERIAQAYRILNRKGVTALEHGLFIRGFEGADTNSGIDEVSLMPGGTLIAELCGEEIQTYKVFARDFNLLECTAGDLHPGSNKAQTSRRMLSNEVQGARRDALLANAAIIFYLAQDLNLKDGVEKSSKLLESHGPYDVLQKYVKLSNGGLL
jgi:anthranilate phosphoribosyltransferase